MTGIIYKWTNTINGKAYIGQTRNEESRKRYHLRANDNLHFHNALRKYGSNNFSYEVLEADIPIENLNDREIYWIAYYDTFNSGYNETTGGCQAMKLSDETRQKLSKARKGIVFTKEHRRNISKAGKGKHSGPFSEEHKRRIKETHPDFSGENNPNWGKKRSAETRRKMSEAQKGRKLSEEMKQQISNTLKGRKQSRDVVERRAKSLKGKTGWNKGMHWKLVNGKRVYYKEEQ